MIGGEIEIDPEYAAPVRGEPIWSLLDLPDGRSAFFGAARECVAWWAEHLKPPGPVLVPAYCCWSVVQPFRELGVPYRYYPVDRALHVDPEQVRKRAAGAGALQVVHYFGFPADPELFDLGVPVLEDAVQAVLSPALRRSGNWAIGSLRKFFAVPDGAFLTGREPFKVPRLKPASGKAYGRKLFGRMLKHDAVARGDRARWNEALEMLLATESALDALHAMSPRTAEALRGVPIAQLAERRRRNYTTLFDALRPVFGAPRSGVRPLLGELPPGVVPYGLPILASHRDELQAHLARRGIHTVVHWDLPDDIEKSEFPDSWWVHERELTLPIDHRYELVDMATIAGAVAAFKPGS